MLKFHLFFLLGLLSLVPPIAAQTTYYVSNTGSDTNPGTSPSAPWQTLAHVSAFDNAGAGFGSGDRILLERGGLWNEAGTLTLASGGTWAAPLGSPTGKITLGAYGLAAAPPRISRFQGGLTADCVKITNSYWRVENIQFENAHRGIWFYGATPGVSDVEVVGCYFKSIENRTDPLAASVGVFFDWEGWTNASVKHCCFDHVSTGVLVATGNWSHNIVVDDCDMFGGWYAGVALKNVDGATILRNRIHDVGDANPVGGTGLILATCRNVNIDRCAIWHVHHGGTHDGCGFDFESDNHNCTMSNCFIYDTDGPAVLMFSGAALPNTGITLVDCLFYNNNLVPHTSSPPNPSANAALHLAGSPVSTGAITDCGIYTNTTSTGHFGGDWSAFTQSAVILASHNPGWTPVYGQFNDLSVGGNGHICAVDSSNILWRWTGSLTGKCWSQIGGLPNVVQASIGHDGELWATDAGNAVWRYSAGAWTLGSSIAMTKISVGSQTNVWGLAQTGTPYLRTSGNFGAIASLALADIDAGPVYGDAWGLNGTSPVRYNVLTSGWVSVPGTLTQISCHSSYTNSVGRFHIAAGVNGSAVQRTVGSPPAWLALPGNLSKVSEGSDGTLWGLDSSGHVWRRY